MSHGWNFFFLFFVLSLMKTSGFIYKFGNKNDKHHTNTKQIHLKAE